MTHKRIKMIESVLGSPDGIHSLKYERGEIYDVPEHLAAIFAKRKLAQVATETLVVDFPDDDQGGGTEKVAAAADSGTEDAEQPEVARVDDGPAEGAAVEVLQITDATDSGDDAKPKKKPRKTRKFSAEQQE